MRSLVVLVLLAGCYPPGYGKDDPSPDAAVSPDAGDAPDADRTAPDAAPVCDGMFRLEGHDTATSVWLTGDFAAWAGMPSAGAIEMTLGVDSAWTATHTFQPGTYQYKFILDGATWISDPANPETVDDGFGGTNSVYACEP